MKVRSLVNCNRSAPVLAHWYTYGYLAKLKIKKKKYIYIYIYNNAFLISTKLEKDFMLLYILISKRSIGNVSLYLISRILFLFSLFGFFLILFLETQCNNMLKIVCISVYIYIYTHTNTMDEYR